MANELEFYPNEGSLSLAIQGTKGTPASANFITALVEDSGLNPEIDRADAPVVHGLASGTQRPTATRGLPRLTGFTGNGTYKGPVYARILPILLVGAGFKLTTVNNTTYYTHTLTIAKRDEWKYITALHKMGAMEMRAADARIPQLSIGGDPEGLAAEATLTSILIDEAAGTETKTNESGVELYPHTGSVSLILDPGGDDIEIAYSGGETASGAEMVTIDNTLLTDQKRMHRNTRASLPTDAMTVSLAASGMDANWDWINYIRSGAVDEMIPALENVLAAYDSKFESAALIPGAIVPYSWRTQIPKLVMTVDPIQLSGSTPVRIGYGGTMYDDGSTEPITITVVNDVASYTG